MPKDPVCGMEINAADSKFRATYVGTTYHFCSAECKSNFERMAKTFSKDVLDAISPTRFMEP